MRSTIKTLGIATMACLALSAFAASAAQAGHTWEVNGVKLASGASESCIATTDGTFTIQSTNGTFHITATSVSTSGCKITQVGSGAAAEATGSISSLTLSGLTVDQPVGCKVTSPITTAALNTKIVTAGGGVAFTTFFPASGTTIANITIKECAHAETYALKGSVCAEMPQAGVFAVQATVKFSATADATCEDKMTLAGSPAILRGGIIFELSGPNTGRTWGFTTT